MNKVEVHDFLLLLHKSITRIQNSIMKLEIRLLELEGKEERLLELILELQKGQ